MCPGQNSVCPKKVILAEHVSPEVSVLNSSAQFGDLKSPPLNYKCADDCELTAGNQWAEGNFLAWEPARVWSRSTRYAGTLRA